MKSPLYEFMRGRPGQSSEAIFEAMTKVMIETFSDYREFWTLLSTTGPVDDRLKEIYSSMATQCEYIWDDYCSILQWLGETIDKYSGQWFKFLNLYFQDYSEPALYRS